MCCILMLSRFYAEMINVVLTESFLWVSLTIFVLLISSRSALPLLFPPARTAELNPSNMQASIQSTKHPPFLVIDMFHFQKKNRQRKIFKNIK